MIYIKVRWDHKNKENPVEMLMELDESGLEQRKIHSYMDGHTQFADANTEQDDTWLSYEPTPSIDEINADPEFQAVVMTKEEFEAAWSKATKT